MVKVRGTTVAIPIGAETVLVRIGERAAVVAVSLRTRDPAEAKRRHSAAQVHLASVWQSFRDAPKALSHRQIVALAGEVYRSMADALEEEPGSPELWATVVGISEAALAGEFGPGRLLIDVPGERRTRASLESWFGPTVDGVLARRAIVADEPTRGRLLVEVAKATIDASHKLKRNAAGDYSHDVATERFPPFAAVASKSEPTDSLTGIVESWWREAKALGRAPSTYESYARTVKQFVALLKHDDAGRVTPEDVVAFKDARLAETNPRSGKTIAPKTIKDSDLAGLKAIFAWAVRNKRMKTNPAREVTLGRGSKTQTRSKDFTSREAAAILTHALGVSRGQENLKTFAAKRWAPWLCAYTGARIGEIAQLRKCDVRREGDQLVITITPDAGPVKTKLAREVPLHSHLIELGFSDFVDAAPDGYLFVNVGSGGEVVGPLQGVKNRVAEFVREVVPDRAVAPNHGWRHLFKTIGVEAGVQERVLDAICGHVPTTVGGRYGQVTLRAKADAVATFPRFRVAE